MTPAQEQAAKIKELAEACNDTYCDIRLYNLSHHRDLHDDTKAKLHAAIDSLASEVDRLSGLAAIARHEDFENWADEKTVLLTTRLDPPEEDCYQYENTDWAWMGWQAAKQHSAAIGAEVVTVANQFSPQDAAKIHQAQERESAKGEQGIYDPRTTLCWSCSKEYAMHENYCPYCTADNKNGEVVK